MAGTPRQTAHSLAQPETLAAQPWTFDFFQVLRRFEVAHPDKPRLGEAARPADEALRLGQDPSLAFAPAALSSFKPGDDRHAPRLGVAFFGLFGPNGPLPLHLTDYACDRVRDADDAGFSRFADIFHHRLLSLFFRAWADAEPVVNRDRPGEDHFSTYVASLLGLGQVSLQDRDLISDHFKLAFAGRLVAQARNAEGLEAMLAADLQVPVAIEEFVGAWITIAESDRWRLGRGRMGGQLGATAFLGKRVWTRDQRFRVVLGPVDDRTYEALLPGGSELARVTALVRGYIGDVLEWDVRLLAKADVRQPMQLGRRGHLGWSSWLGPRANIRPRQDLVFQPERLAS
jgi:type VI secretion system protein ImpH